MRVAWRSLPRRGPCGVLGRDGGPGQRRQAAPLAATGWPAGLGSVSHAHARAAVGVRPGYVRGDTTQGFGTSTLLVSPDLTEFSAVWEKLVPFAPLPGGTHLRSADVPVGAEPTRDVAEVRPQLGNRRPAPKPITIVNLVDLGPWLQDQRVRDHRVIRRIGVLLDVQVVLDHPLR